MFKFSLFKVKFLSSPLTKTCLCIVVGLLIALLGYQIRLHQFRDFPPLGDTFDEVKAPFNGINLIQKGIPISWSWYDEYGEFPVQKIRGTDFRLVQPWFDEPPLFSLVAGAYSISKGMDTEEKVDAGVLRYPMVKLAAFNIFALFLIILILRNFIEASLASLIYATEPTMVFGSRLPVSDNFLVSIILITLLFLIFYLKKQKWYLLGVLAILSSSGLLIKSTGIFIPMAIIFLLGAHRKFKQALLVAGFMFIAFGGWLYYGYYYNWDVFSKIFVVSSGRELFKPDIIIHLFDTFRIGEKSMNYDGWLMWGWISVVAYSFINRDSHKSILSRITLPVVVGSYLVFFSIMSGHAKGWYRFPFFPFLSWASAAFFIEIVKNPRFLFTFFFITIPVFSSYIYGNGVKRWSNMEIKIYQLVFVLLMSLPMLYELFQNKYFKMAVQVILISAFIIAIIFNIRTIYSFQDHFWY
ncbi:MAG: glycosyltransferase family 39 protein [Candidatus Daviesbacteria bacterium]|nr:glycosyltransferase family 39 protein [Candidatus Daviesbacteria bacterium]